MNVAFGKARQLWEATDSLRPLDRRRLAVVLTAATAAVAGELVHWQWGTPLPAVGLALGPAISLAAGLLFALPGILGVAAGQLLFSLAEGLNPGSVIALAAVHAAVGALGFETFRRAPGVGRGLPNLRSYFGLVACATAGSLLAAAGEGALGAGGPGFVAGAVAFLVSSLLVVPPALLAADRFLRPWLAPIPGEVANLLVNRLIPPAGDADATPEETILISQRRTGGSHRLLVGLAGIPGTTLIAVLLIPLSTVESWLALLYLPAVLGVAWLYGLRGGVLAASAAGVLYLVARGGMIFSGAAATEVSALPWAAYGAFTLLGLVAALLGASRQRETALSRELFEQGRLLRRDLLRVVNALARAVEAKDAYTLEHLRRVSGYAMAVGEKLGLAGHELETLFYGSMLHDIGKIGVPEEVLRKEGPLTAEQEEIMRRHPQIGADIVRDLELLRDAAPLILHHQERYDGATDETRYPGYPGGLAGEAIPLGARIIAVVDAFDAMTTDRPYRKGLSPEQAAAELTKRSGRQFDPRVVEALFEVLEERPWVVGGESA